MSWLKEVSTRGNVPWMVKVDEEQVRGHLDLMMRRRLSKSLIAFWKSKRRGSLRAAILAKLHTKVVEVTLYIPRVRNLNFKTLIIKRDTKLE